jgi:hypothetical protein
MGNRPSGAKGTSGSQVASCPVEPTVTIRFSDLCSLCKTSYNLAVKLRVANTSGSDVLMERIQKITDRIGLQLQDLVEG